MLSHRDLSTEQVKTTRIPHRQNSWCDHFPNISRLLTPCISTPMTQCRCQNRNGESDLNRKYKTAFRFSYTTGHLHQSKYGYARKLELLRRTLQFKRKHQTNYKPVKKVGKTLHFKIPYFGTIPAAFPHGTFGRSILRQKVRKTPDFLSKSGVFMVAEAGLEPTTSGL